MKRRTAPPRPPLARFCMGFDEPRLRRLRRVSKDLRISISALARVAIWKYLQREGDDV